MSQCAASPALDICPSENDLIPQYLMLWPRGRAWGENGAARLPGGIIYGFTRYMAILMAALHAAICALTPEFWCFSAKTTYESWLEEYGLPDDCDPFPDPCSKILANGGPTPANLVALAALTGVAIEVSSSAASLTITVHGLEPATAPADNYAHGARLSGHYQAGQKIVCDTGVGPFLCLMQRVIHAHVEVSYVYA